MHKSRSRAFRQLLEKPGLVLRPCGYDALSALLIEKAGFRLMGTSGYAISASSIGQPDLGLISFGELLERARNIISSVSIPVDIDADTGYGNALNAYWTAKNYSQKPNFLYQSSPPRKRSIQYPAKLSFEAFSRKESRIRALM